MQGYLAPVAQELLALARKRSYLIGAGVTATGLDTLTGRAPSIATEDRPQMHDTFYRELRFVTRTPVSKEPGNE